MRTGHLAIGASLVVAALVFGACAPIGGTLPSASATATGTDAGTGGVAPAIPPAPTTVETFEGPATTAAPRSAAPSPATTPAPSPPATAAPSPPATAAPEASQTPEPTTTPVPAVFLPGGPWVPAGKGYGTGWSRSALVPLGDGGALFIGREATEVERWAEGSRSWTRAPGLPSERVDYAAVPLRDGGVVVAGGLDTRDWDRLRSYSSAYTFDPRTGSWTKVGLMGTARVAPAGALLPDGRVLVAGGAYKDGPGFADAGATHATLASVRVGGPVPGRRRTPTDSAPPNMGRALATAEILDPRTGRWSPTGSMRYAVAGAVAATLSDGRVLVVAPASIAPGWGSVEMDARALDTAEIFDPASGRFTLVGGLPPVDWGPLHRAGIGQYGFYPEGSSAGTLVPLPGGDALLVGHSVAEHNGTEISRSFRYHGATRSWTQVGPTWACGRTGGYLWTCLGSIDLSGAIAAALPDGRVLVAGGRTQRSQATDVARIYDPATSAWTWVEHMPVGRSGGVATTVADGSVLITGGTDTAWETPVAVRYIPPG